MKSTMRPASSMLQHRRTRPTRSGIRRQSVEQRQDVAPQGLDLGILRHADLGNGSTAASRRVQLRVLVTFTRSRPSAKTKRLWFGMRTTLCTTARLPTA